ncbi:ABC transporter permease subunit [Candidatus Micrarchaeota archaeon]|nr:ABC transporter permease subunit [Candidatus Micrarchaeota archaeon]
MKGRHILIFAIFIAIALFYTMGEEALMVPYYILRSLLRMTSAYILTLIFSLTFGILIAHNERAFRILFPVMDILQSIPVLGFVPFAMFFLITVFPGFGTEIVSIFLIFTSMTWAVLFNIVEGVKTIPSYIKDISKMNNIKGLNYLFHVVLPALYPPLISGSVTGWGGAWYFLVVGEYLIFADNIYILSGIGSFISKSAYSGDMVLSLLGIGVLAVVVLSINRFVWQPLLFRARKYSYGCQETYIESGESAVLALENAYREGVKEKLTKSKFFSSFFGKLFSFLGISPYSKIKKEETLSLSFLALLFIILVGLGSFIAYETSEFVEGWMVLSYSLRTIIRIIIAYLLALFWTLAVALSIARNKELLRMLMPIFDVGQSIPAVAVFPIIVVIVIQVFGGGLGIEIASVFLIMTGTQWYLLFNLIRAIRSIPGEILDLSKIMRLNTSQRLRNIIIPAIIPAIIIGSVEAIGGGLNATIVSEYIVYKDQVFYTEGLGYMMAEGAALGDSTAIILSVISMMLIVLLVNKFVWKRMLEKVERYSFGEGHG